MRIIIAWIKKYIFHIHSPSAHARGYDFEFDYLKSLKNKRIIELEKENADLSLRISELEAELEESRAKEGKGILENTIDGICKALNSIDFQSIISEKVVDEYSTNIESMHCKKYDDDCFHDCDFDCENCERAKLEEEKNNE